MSADLSTLLTSRDQGIEQAVLCKILTTGRIPPDILPEYFCGEERQILESMKKHYEKFYRIDIPVLKEQHKDSGIIESILQKQGSYTEAAKDVLHRNWQRRGIGTITSLIGECDDPDDVLLEIQKKCAGIAIKSSDGEYCHADEVSKVLNMVEKGQINKRETVGYSTGLLDLDNLVSGIEHGKVYAIGALKKTGKSRFLIFLSVKLSEQGAGVMWNSLEMSREQLNTLAVSYYTGINSAKLGRQMEPGEYQKIGLVIHHVNALKWCIYREPTVAALKSRILYERMKRPVDVVVIDYIQRMFNPAIRGERTKELESVAIGLADMAKELNVAVIELAQLRGEAENLKKTEMPNMSHFKDTQAIPESADVIMTMHNPDKRENPYSQDGSYKFAEINCLVEQRYDVSGARFRFIGDLRNCQFRNHKDPYGRD